MVPKSEFGSPRLVLKMVDKCGGSSREDLLFCLIQMYVCFIYFIWCGGLVELDPVGLLGVAALHCTGDTAANSFNKYDSCTACGQTICDE